MADAETASGSSSTEPAVKAVVFDAVGTLIVPEPSAVEVYAEVGRHYGSRLAVGELHQRFADAFARQEAVDRAANWRTSEHREFERWRRIVAEVLDDVTAADDCFTTLYQHFARPGSWRCQPETAAVLDRLAGLGLQLALASNFDERLIGVVAGLPELQRLRGRLLISSTVGWRKPAAEFFAAVRTAVDLPANRILYLGDDRGNDYDGATLCGFRGLLFDPSDRATAGGGGPGVARSAAEHRIVRLAQVVELLECCH